MNNTKTLAIVAVLTAATLVLGGTLAAASAQSVFPLPNIGAQNDGKGGNGGGGGGGHPANLKKGAHDNGKDNGKRNDNTDADTIQKCKQFASGFDPSFGDQNCDNLSDSTITQAAETPVTPPSEVGCPSGTLYNVRLLQDLGDSGIPTGTVLCLLKKLGDQLATISTQTPVTGFTTIEVVVAQPNQDPCNNSGGNSGFVLARVDSIGTPGPGNPIVFGGTVCVKDNSG